MRKIFLVVAFAAAGCASGARAPFEPSADPRIGVEIEKACFSDIGGRSGGVIEISDHKAMVIGRFDERYLLVFSSGCGNLGHGGDIPVFYNYGDNCRRRGERVGSVDTTTGISGACTIKHIYEWRDESGKDAQN